MISVKIVEKIHEVAPGTFYFGRPPTVSMRAWAVACFSAVGK